MIVAKPAAKAGLLKPLARAWFLGYLSSVAPRFIGLLVALLRGKRTANKTLNLLSSAAGSGLRLTGFPTFCGVVIGGSTLFQRPARAIISLAIRHANFTKTEVSHFQRRVIARFISALLASWLGFYLLNLQKKVTEATGALASISAPSVELQDPDFDRKVTAECRNGHKAGRTMDLTLFAATRAVDVLVGEVWAQYQRRRKGNGQWTSVEKAVSSLADGSVFAVSSGLVMWAWLYLPQRLPDAYNKWIREAAAVDDRLVEALRRARNGEWIYGRDTGQAPLLQSMCRDYSWPARWGDPAKQIPIPCELVHMGSGSSCEKHAFDRFAKAFKFAMATYVPLNLIIKFRSPTSSNLKRALRDSVRSSTFLASFIALFYYSICLARTRLGPRIFSSKTVSPMQWDGGLCVGAGCAMCGWSILIEAEQRRHEIAFFVAPRAAAVLAPRKYNRKFLYREGIVFALSTAAVLTFVQEKPARVRGVFGRVLRKVLS
ncbi:MAG: hypothetical protein M1814_005002 [Vezdaea aestivalis]|nr:MAG: hypothetical protein M1814_005002 [Vezdaea aestivalis]